jgi:hypothetical protein
MIPRDSQDDALDRAQQVMYDAWDATTSRSRMAPRKALEISPLCADAYNLLAQEAATPAEARDLYTRGLAAGEQAIGPEGCAEYDGHFWGFWKCDPTCARQGLALTLLELGEYHGRFDGFHASSTSMSKTCLVA